MSPPPRTTPIMGRMFLHQPPLPDPGPRWPSPWTSARPRPGRGQDGLPERHRAQGPGAHSLRQARVTGRGDLYTGKVAGFSFTKRPFAVSVDGGPGQPSPRWDPPPSRAGHLFFLRLVIPDSVDCVPVTRNPTKTCRNACPCHPDAQVLKVRNRIFSIPVHRPPTHPGTAMWTGACERC